MPQKEAKYIDEDHNNAPLSTISRRQLPHRARPSSSTTSHSKGRDSALLGFGLRRAILIGRRGGPSTPVPSWKVSDNSILDPSLEHHLHHSSHRHRLQQTHQGQGLVISARKLAASLWELQESPFSKSGPTCTQENVQKMFLSVHQEASLTEQHCVQDGQHLSPALSHISKGSHKRSPIRIIKSGDKGRIYAKLEKRRGHQILPDYRSEIGSQTFTPKSLVLSSKGILSNLSCGPTTTSDLLKILNHVWQLEEQHASSMSLVGTLRVELDEARSQLQELLLNEKNFRKEVDNISTRIAEERALWKEQEQYVMVAVRSVMQDLENERKSKQKLEVLHKNVAKEFRLARKSLFRALEDLERERKARQLMEDVCDELAIEIGQDKARVEELKLESVKVREEVEEERKMLQMAEIWREERVQMKLMEAKLELEEKNTAFHKLRSQLEAFLKTRRAGDSANGVTSDTNLDSGRHSSDIVSGRNLSDFFHSREQRGTQSGRYSVDSGCDQQVKQSAWSSYSDDDDDDEDLHSIELNHEPMVRTASGNSRQQSFQHCGKEIVKRGLSDDSISTRDNCERLLSRFQGVETLETPRNDQQMNSSGREAGAESSAQGSVLQSCRWIERTIEGGEIREWREEQEGDLQQWSRKSTKSWSSGVEDSQSLIPVSPTITTRSNEMHMKSVFKTIKTSHHLRHEEYRKFGGSQHQPCLSNMASSPTRKWNHYFDLRSKVTTETGGDIK